MFKIKNHKLFLNISLFIFLGIFLIINNFHQVMAVTKKNHDQNIISSKEKDKILKNHSEENGNEFIIKVDILTEKTQETKKKKRASASKKTLEENTQETKKKKKASSPEKSDYHVSASEVASITGHDSYRSMKQLVVDKLFGTNFTANQYTLHGQKMEPIARKFFNDKNDLTFEKVSFYNEEFKLFAALDGYNEEKKAVLEIKCPFMDKDQKVSNTWDSFLKDPQPENIPKNYWAQVQCQLFCSKAKLAYFLVYFNEEKYYVVDVYPDNAFISKMIEDSQNYLEFLKNCVEELENTTYLKQLKKLSKKSKLKSNN